jgi:hypothetical protein
MEDSQARIAVLINCLATVLERVAEGGLFLPLKVTATCAEGFVFGASISFSGCRPTFGPAEVTWPITITCIGENGKKMTATIDHRLGRNGIDKIKAPMSRGCYCHLFSTCIHSLRL